MTKVIQTLYVLTIIPDAPNNFVWGKYKATRRDSLSWSIIDSTGSPYGCFPDRSMYNVEYHPSRYENGRYVIRGFEELKIKEAWNKYVDDNYNKVIGLQSLKFPLE
jgi:hypothetical protein